MIVRGKVIHSETNASIEGAKVTINIDDIPFFEGNSIEEGLFEKISSENYLGATLYCRVEKGGFEIWERWFEIETEEQKIQAAMDPKTIELQINISDQKGKGLEGAKINLKLNKTVLWEGVSN